VVFGLDEAGWYPIGVGMIDGNAVINLIYAGLFNMQIAAVMLTEHDDVHSRFFQPFGLYLAAWHGKGDEVGDVKFGRFV